MTNASPADRLARLFREAGTAHHAAFAAANGDDPEWPDWYAAYLAGPIADLLGHPLDPAALASDLRAVDAAHRAGGREGWPEYYAGWFLHRATERVTSGESARVDRL